MSKDSSETRVEALKRELGTSQRRESSLQDLINSLRDDPEDVAQATLKQLRTDSEFASTREPKVESDTSSLDGQSSHQLESAVRVQDLSPSSPSSGSRAATADFSAASKYMSTIPYGEQTMPAAGTKFNRDISFTMAFPGADLSGHQLMIPPSGANAFDTYAHQTISTALPELNGPLSSSSAFSGVDFPGHQSTSHPTDLGWLDTYAQQPPHDRDNRGNGGDGALWMARQPRYGS